MNVAFLPAQSELICANATMARESGEQGLTLTMKRLTMPSHDGNPRDLPESAQHCFCQSQKQPKLANHASNDGAALTDCSAYLGVLDLTTYQRPAAFVATLSYKWTQA